MKLDSNLAHNVGSNTGHTFDALTCSKTSTVLSLASLGD